MTPGWTACVCPPAPASLSTLHAPSRLGATRAEACHVLPLSLVERIADTSSVVEPTRWTLARAPGRRARSQTTRSTRRTIAIIRVSVSDAPRCARPNRRCPHRSPPARTGVFQTAVRDDSSTVAPRFPSAISDAGVFHSGDCAHVRGCRGRLRLRSLPAAWNCQCASAHCLLLHIYNAGHLDL